MIKILLLSSCELFTQSFVRLLVLLCLVLAVLSPLFRCLLRKLVEAVNLFLFLLAKKINRIIKRRTDENQAKESIIIARV